MTDIVSKPDHGNILVKEGKATEPFQLYLDDIEQNLNIFLLLGFTVEDLTTIVPPATTPKVPASSRLYGMVMVTDETSGVVPAFSDGFSWRRVTDRAVVS